MQNCKITGAAYSHFDVKMRETIGKYTCENEMVVARWCLHSLQLHNHVLYSSPLSCTANVPLRPFNIGTTAARNTVLCGHIASGVVAIILHGAHCAKCVFR